MDNETYVKLACDIYVGLISSMAPGWTDAWKPDDGNWLAYANRALDAAEAFSEAVLERLAGEDE